MNVVDIFSRSAYRRGLQLEERLGANPFKFGLVGSTDAHTALATAEEDNQWGKITILEPKAERAEHYIIESKTYPELSTFGWEQAASGYAAVWATENTREAIFDAMMRQETYATTGSRMVVRFFGGWDFTVDDANTRWPAGAGYEKGVPMGSDLTDAPEGAAPSFLVAARKDRVDGLATAALDLAAQDTLAGLMADIGVEQGLGDTPAGLHFQD